MDHRSKRRRFRDSEELLKDWKGKEKRGGRVGVSKFPLVEISFSLPIGGPIQCVVSYRDHCAHKHINYECVYVCTDLYMKLHTELGAYGLPCKYDVSFHAWYYENKFRH